MRCARTQSRRRRGFTFFELEVAIMLLGFGLATLGSLITTQTRVLRHVRGDFKNDAILYVTPTNDPWSRQLGVPARISAAPLTLSPPPSAPIQLNDVVILNVQTDLTAESITVDAQVTHK